MARNNGCIICHSRTQELDETGRCGSCAAAKAALEAGTTYGKYMARKSAPVFENAKHTEAGNG